MLKSKKLLIKSSLSELYRVEAFVEAISDVYNINNNYYSTILISLVEAVRNAIEHGNKFESNKKVSISFSTNRGELIFTVQDEGKGFKLTDIPDPTSPEFDVNQEVGKGLFLMKQLSDRIDVNNEKKEVSLYFKVSSINKDLAVQRTSALKSFFQENRKTIKA